MIENNEYSCVFGDLTDLDKATDNACAQRRKTLPKVEEDALKEFDKLSSIWELNEEVIYATLSEGVYAICYFVTEGSKRLEKQLTLHSGRQADITSQQELSSYR